MKVKSHLNVNNLPDDESRHPNLSPNTVYTVIGIDNDHFRVVNDSFEPVLYPKTIFDVLDNNIPSEWVRLDFDDGEYFIDPPEFAEIGFFESYFDGEDKAVTIYEMFLKNNGIKIPPEIQDE